MTPLVAGVDEAGRGPLAGSVMAAAVILDPHRPIEGLADSKKLNACKRERLAAEIREKAISWAIAEASVVEIDRLNILQASLLAMRRALETLTVPADSALIDGNQLPSNLPCPAKTLVRGDERVPVISAASILAKVARDETMRMLDARYPLYGFASHKGYATTQHIKALMRHGPCPCHRASFAPVRKAMGQG